MPAENDLLESYDAHDDDDAPSAPAWMTTYSDMVTLLLTFFVLIVSMSEIELEKFKEAVSYFQGRVGVLQQDAVVQSMGLQFATQSSIRATSYEELLRYIEEAELDGKVEVTLEKEGIRVTITDSVMFRSGEAVLLPQSLGVLDKIAQTLQDQVESVVVEGHTDTYPIQTERYPSNWELSSARAASVLRFLLQQANRLDPWRYVAIGYGEHHPVYTNQTPEGRAKNRRVEIFFSWEPWQNKLNFKQPLHPQAP